jgi:hypothetical protein
MIVTALTVTGGWHVFAPHFMHYNICSVHKVLKVTPVAKACIYNHMCGLDEPFGLLERSELEAASGFGDNRQFRLPFPVYTGFRGLSHAHGTRSCEVFRVPR